MNDFSESERLRRALLEQFYRECRRDLVVCTKELLAPLVLLPHHELLLRHMQKVVDGQITRLIVIGPPGMGKSTLLSYVAVAWALAHRPGLQIISVTHSQSFAERTSENVQRYVQNHEKLLGYRLLNDARGRWVTSNGGEVLHVSVGQRIRGARAQIVLIDDVYGGRADAESETIREGVYGWFKSDAMSRPLEPTDAVVLTSTAYHEQDLMVRLIREEADRWTVLRIPAISEGIGDPLNRLEGEPLAAGLPYGNYLLERRAEFERIGLTREWEASYQGAPQPPAGAMFKPQQMPIFDAVPRTTDTVRAWDLASSPTGDWTAGIKMARVRDWAAYKDTLIILDVRRLRGTPEQVRHLVRTVAEADGTSVKIWLPLDPAQAGKDQADSYTRMLSGYRVDTERMSGDKITRADAVASQCNIGCVGMLKAPWNNALIEELAAFPAGRHDDQVDALSLAFSKLARSSLEVWAKMSDRYDAVSGTWQR